MSRTKNEGKRSKRRIKLREDAPGVNGAIQKRHWYGHTEKILRRNRRMWVRLGNKRRRRFLKQRAEEQQS